MWISFGFVNAFGKMQFQTIYAIKKQRITYRATRKIRGLG
jgi:hypothetical protein